jgi:hypothetical protein
MQAVRAQNDVGWAMRCVMPRAIEALGWGFVGWVYAGVKTPASLRFWLDCFAVCSGRATADFRWE